MHIHVYMYTCIYVYMRMRIHVYMALARHKQGIKYAYTHIYMNTCVYVYLHMHTGTSGAGKQPALARVCAGDPAAARGPQAPPPLSLPRPPRLLLHPVPWRKNKNTARPRPARPRRRKRADKVRVGHAGWQGVGECRRGVWEGVGAGGCGGGRT